MPVNGCRCLKSCQDVATPSRTDLCNSLLSCTVYTSADVPANAILREVTSCLKAFLKGCIDEEFQRSNLSTGSQQAQQSCRMLQEAEVTRDNANGVDCPNDSAEASGSDSGGDVSTDADAIDDYLKPPVMHRHWQPLVTIVGVPALPKGALVEVQPEAFTVDAVAEAASSSSSSDDDNGSDHSSIAGLRQSHAPAQTDNNRMQGWPGQLQHEQSIANAPSGVCWSSLIAGGTYCCCQISFEVCEDASGLHESACMAMRAAGDRLQAAGLAAKHIMQACMHVQQLSQDKQQKVKKLFQDVWHAQHGVRVPLLLLPVSHIFSGSGSELQQVTASQASLHLTAHCA